MQQRVRVASGVGQLDLLLGGLFIGDNVLWYDDAGSLASVFCLNFLQSSQSQGKPIIYVTFDRSPKNLLEKLGVLAEYPQLTIMDCFTSGKGGDSEVFTRFYDQPSSEWPCEILRMEHPSQLDAFTDALYGIHSRMEGDVRLVFESITGMQELWGGEEQFLGFYVHSCPRLYELQTIAYWVLEKNAHSSRFRAQMNQIAQVAIELSIKRGTTTLSILKGEGRDSENFHKPHRYWTRDLSVRFDDEKKTTSKIDLGLRLKELRIKRGLSQTELAKLVGVTPSTISQIESNFIYPSLPTLLKMAEVLFVDVSTFFQDRAEPRKRLVFNPAQAVEVKLPNLPEGSLSANLLTPIDFDGRAEPYVIEVPPGQTLSSHFFIHKGDELGYLLSGKLQFKVGKEAHVIRSGNLVYLSSEMPTEWKNTGASPAKLLWIKVK